MQNTDLKYTLYEASVQDPHEDAKMIASLYRRIRKKEVHHIREDFCGTFALATAWVRQNKKNTAIGLDLSPEPLDYGLRHHFAKLKTDEQKRLHVLKKNVFSRTEPKQVIAAFNFSYFFIKSRKELIRYFRYCHQSLTKDGILLMDILGGYHTENLHVDRYNMRTDQKIKFKYIWQQVEFDPITREALFHIHFEVGKQKMRKAFIYPWRFWTIPEIRDCLQEAGFKKSLVFWEGHNGKWSGNGKFHQAEKEENDPCWLAYIVGVK